MPGPGTNARPTTRCCHWLDAVQADSIWMMARGKKKKANGSELHEPLLASSDAPVPEVAPKAEASISGAAVVPMVDTKAEDVEKSEAPKEAAVGDTKEAPKEDAVSDTKAEVDAEKSEAPKEDAVSDATAVPVKPE